MMRKFAAELLGTGLLVFFGVGVATLMFGFKFDGGSVAAGVVATALAFGLVLLALAYALRPISGCHMVRQFFGTTELCSLVVCRLVEAHTGSRWLNSFAASSARCCSPRCSILRPLPAPVPDGLRRGRLGAASAIPGVGVGSALPRRGECLRCSVPSSVPQGHRRTGARGDRGYN